MPQQQKTGHGGARKIGRSARKPTKVNYKNHNRRFINKLKRVRQSNGEKAAREYERNKPCHAKRYAQRTHSKPRLVG